MNFMVVILNRGLDKNNQLLSDESNIYQNLGDFTRKWEDCGVVSDCEELVGVTWRLSDSVKD